MSVERRKAECIHKSLPQGHGLYLIAIPVVKYPGPRQIYIQLLTEMHSAIPGGHLPLLTSFGTQTREGKVKRHS